MSGPTNLTPAALKARFNDSLDQVGTTSTFACGEHNAILPNPGLSILSYGDVGLPLSSRDAQGIIETCCKKSAFGKGSDTIIDESVRKSWELDASHFTTSNPAWHNRITDHILPKIHDKLGLVAPLCEVRAELYKMLIYEEGAFFKPHQDSEKTPGMFGTLVVALPSLHQGGDIILRHGGRGMDFQTSLSSKWDFSWSAWYADVFHEVQPVTKGTRFVLTYNLAVSSLFSSIRMTGPAGSSEHHGALKQAFHDWGRAHTPQSGLPTYLVHHFEHKYTEANFSLSSLKGTDRARADLLKRAADETGSLVLLGTAQLYVTEDEGDYPGYGEATEIERETTLENLRTFDGKDQKITGFQFVPSNTLKSLTFDEDDPDEEEESEGYTGNEGCPHYYWYRKAVCLIIPESLVDIFMLETSNKWHWATKRIHELLDTLDTDMMAESKLRRLSGYILNEVRTANRKPFSYSHFKPSHRVDEEAKPCLQAIALAGLRTQVYDWYDGALADGQIIPDGEVFTEIGSVLARRGSEQMLTRLLTALELLPRPAERFKRYEHVLRGFKSQRTKDEDDSSKDSQEWELVEAACQTVIMESAGNLDKSDGRAMAQVAARLAFDNEASRSEFVRMLRQKSTACKIGFLLSWCGDSSSTSIDSSNHSRILVPILEDTLCSLNQSSLNPSATRSSQSMHHNRAQHQAVTYESAGGAVQAEQIVKLLDIAMLVKHQPCAAENTLDIEIEMTLEQIQTKILDAITISSLSDLRDVWLPFAEEVVNKNVHVLLSDSQEPAPATKEIVKKVISRIVTDVLGPRPEPPTTWAQEPKNTCPCAICADILTFLRDPKRESYSIRHNQRDRKHLDSSFHSYANRGSSNDYSTQNISSGRGKPYFWQITKNRTSYDRAVKEWDQNASKTWKKLAGLNRDNSFLREFVGNEIVKAMRDKNLKKLMHCLGAEYPTAAELNERKVGQQQELEAGSNIAWETPVPAPPPVPRTPVLGLTTGNGLNIMKRSNPEGGFGAGQPEKRIASGSGGLPVSADDVIDLTGE